MNANRSIFRIQALQRYLERRDKTVLPHYVRSRRHRVPVILQMNATECGAACLAMILSHYGRKMRVAECREALAVGRDGVTAQQISKAARRFGLRVKAYSIQAWHDFQYVQLPAIAHWNFEHFVVIEKWSSTLVEVVDPAIGRRCLSIAEFSEAFTGIILTFEPGTQFEKRAIAPGLPWHNFLWRIWRMPGLLGQILLASIVLQGIGLVLPFFTQFLVDHVLAASRTDQMQWIGVGMVVVVLTQCLISYLRATLLIRLQTYLDAQLMLDFFEHLLSLPFAFFQVRNSGDLLMRLSSNASIREVLTSQTLSALLDGAFVVIYLAVLLGNSPSFALLTTAVGIIQVLLLLGSAKWVHTLTQSDLAAQSEAQSYLVETLSGIVTLKATGTSVRAFERWSNLFHTSLNTAIQRSRASALMNSLLNTVHMAAPLALLWLGIAEVRQGTVSLGEMLGLNALAVAFLSPLTTLVGNIRQLQMVGAQLERLADVLQAEPEQDLSSVVSAPILRGQIELSNVTFHYTTDTPAVLQNISVRIEAGQKIAIVGRSGSGKSTLAKLLLGLYTPTSGEIYFDGQPLSSLNYQSVRSQIGVVMQESFLFSGSIRSNIAFTEPNLPFEQVQLSAQLAAIREEIEQLPMGYETRVAEGGAGLSGGQRQRLSLARALATRPTILLLDEATSHLDVVTEQMVEGNLNTLPSTRIVIAHRLSTIINSDLILVLAGGVLVEQGTHQSLLARGGCYARLIENQTAKIEHQPVSTTPIHM